jgi:hypothetical protein
MRIQGIRGVEFFVAHITLPEGAVECAAGSCVFDILILAPPDLLIGDDAMWVTLTNHAEDGFAVKIGGARAGTCLEVVGEAAGGGVVDLAEGAGEVGAAVDF